MTAEKARRTREVVKAMQTMVFHRADTVLEHAGMVFQRYLIQAAAPPGSGGGQLISLADVQTVFLDMAREATSDALSIDFLAIVEYLTRPSGNAEFDTLCAADVCYLPEDPMLCFAASVVESRGGVPNDFVLRLFIRLLSNGDTTVVLSRVSSRCRNTFTIYQMLLTCVHAMDAVSVKTSLELHFCAVVQGVRVRVLRFIEDLIGTDDLSGFARSTSLALDTNIFDIQCLYTYLFKCKAFDVSFYVMHLLSLKMYALPVSTPFCPRLCKVIEDARRDREKV